MGSYNPWIIFGPSNRDYMNFFHYSTYYKLLWTTVSKDTQILHTLFHYPIQDFSLVAFTMLWSCDLKCSCSYPNRTILTNRRDFHDRIISQMRINWEDICRRDGTQNLVDLSILIINDSQKWKCLLTLIRYDLTLILTQFRNMLIRFTYSIFSFNECYWH